MKRRTTFRIDDELLEAAQAAARRLGISVNKLVEDALRAVAARAEPATASPRIELVVAGAGGVLPGVHLDDSESLRDLMDRGEPGEPMMMDNEAVPVTRGARLARPRTRRTGRRDDR